MLRDGGQVEWPLALMGDHQKKLDKLLPEAYSAAAGGKLTPKLMKEVRKELKDMRQTMRDQLQKDEIETSSYLQGIEFYNSLVQELIDFMTDKGLLFAPATPGNENAYKVAHDAFVRYARAAQSSAGFTSMSAPMRAPNPGKK
jgi:hypothetical protein